MAESAPFLPFRFQVSLFAGASLAQGGQLVCAGAFSEVSGLEATMTPKKFAEGGRNWGELQRAGPVTFGTVTLKRGVTSVGDLWSWFDAVAREGNGGMRLSAEIEVRDDVEGAPLLRIKLTNVLPVKFKAPDLNAAATQVAVEELQLVHEGLVVERRAG
ncbi:MAG: phage tail protein [Planctomycetes bacterium]|nr:phage tail protein [Planctomycetota bacterium]